MSSSDPGNDAPTPDRRASSNALFSAFRNLGGRLKSPTPPPTVASASFTPFRTSLLGAVLQTDAFEAQSAPPLRAPAPHRGGLKGVQAPKGGPKELDALVVNVNRSHALSKRVAAIDKIAKIMAEYPVRNVLGLWTEASDLVEKEQPAETALVGYKLLRSCVALPGLTPIERTTFFGAAVTRGDVFDVRLDIIATLTRNGRDIEACKALLPAFLAASLDTCFADCDDAVKARARSKKSADRPLKEAENLAHLFQYIIDICKFNSKLFNHKELEELLDKAMAICQKTTRRADIENAIRLFDTIITYVHIPPNSMKPCLGVLCLIYRQLEDLKEQAWHTLTNLFKSHFGQAAVSALLHTLRDEQDASALENRDYSRYRGASLVLERLLLDNGRSELPRVPVSLLIPALKASIKEPHETQEAFVISLLASVLAEEEIRNILLKEADWAELLDILRICSGRNDTRAAKGTGLGRGAVDRAASIAGTVSPTIGAADRSASVASTTGEIDHGFLLNGDAPPAAPIRADVVRRNEDDDISKLLVGLYGVCRDMELIQKSALMELFMQLAHRLNDSIAEDVIKFYIEERYFHPSHGEWMEACRSLVSGFLKDTSRPRSIRILCIQTLRETYNIVEGICSNDIVMQCAALLLNNIEVEVDVEVLHELVDFAVDVIDRAPDTGFSENLAVLQRRLELHKANVLHSPAVSPHNNWISSPFNVKPLDHPLGTLCNVLATAFVRLFIRSVRKSAQKTRVLYEILRHIVGCDAFESDARLTAIKLLFRLRAESNHALIINTSSEGESIATVLCRTMTTAMPPEKYEEAAISESGKPEDAMGRDQRKAMGSNPHASVNKHSVRQSNTGRVAKSIPPLWIYGGPKGLPEAPPSQASPVVFSHIDQEEYPLSDDILDMEVTLWLELVISLLQRVPDWEIYSYVLVHLGPQLSNQALVRSCVAQLRMLRNVVCEQLRNSTFHEPPGYTMLKKADVAVCLFHLLTVLISYHDHFEKSEEDDIVKTFLHGISYWDRTSIWCIHALTVCCHEMPLSVSKSLDNVIQKMSQIITKPSTAIHILEFLTGVSRMPDLYKNFREEDYRMIFGVCFRYLQHVRDHRGRASSAAITSTQSIHRSLRHSGASRDFTASPDRHTSVKNNVAVDELPQYVYSLAYHVITFWFICLKMEDRPKQIPWVTKNLFYPDSSGKQVMEEQGLVIVDMMNNMAYSDRGETKRDPNFAKEKDGKVWSKTWIAGNSLITVETASRTGVTVITSRRPSGTRFMYTHPLLAPLPRHQIPLTLDMGSDGFHTSQDVAILPDDIFQTYFSPLNLVDPAIALPDDLPTRRAIETFDRNATVDGYKVGVIYIGEGQMGQVHEREILNNNMGSAAYTSFLTDLGTLVRLKGAEFNTGGLDRNNDTDGEFTYCWRDRVIELVFHITTMMPNDADPMMTYANKKRHIGNDYVNIIWNESGLSYDFETFPSQFNYVAIVITPESRASFVDRRLDTDPDGKNRYYKVQVITKPDFPDISPAVEPKILCGKYLGAFCRLLAINASVFSQVWAIRDGGESISSWRNRLREIKRLRERYRAVDMPVSNPSSPGTETAATSGFVSPPPREPSAPSFKRTSVVTMQSEGTNRSSITGMSQD